MKTISTLLIVLSVSVLSGQESFTKTDMLRKAEEIIQMANKRIESSRSIVDNKTTRDTVIYDKSKRIIKKVRTGTSGSFRLAGGPITYFYDNFGNEIMSRNEDVDGIVGQLIISKFKGNIKIESRFIGPCKFMFLTKYNTDSNGEISNEYYTSNGRKIKNLKKLLKLARRSGRGCEYYE